MRPARATLERSETESSALPETGRKQDASGVRMPGDVGDAQQLVLAHERIRALLLALHCDLPDRGGNMTAR